MVCFTHRDYIYLGYTCTNKQANGNYHCLKYTKYKKTLTKSPNILFYII